MKCKLKRERERERENERAKEGREAAEYVEPLKPRESERDGRVGERFGGERERDERRKESETRERAKAREIGKRGHWLFVARSTYGIRYGPGTAFGMCSFFLFVSPSYLANHSPSIVAAAVAAVMVMVAVADHDEPLVGNPAGRQPATGEGSSSI